MPTGMMGVSFPGPYEGIFFFQDTLQRSWVWNGKTATRIADSIGTGNASPGIAYINGYIYQCGGDTSSMGSNDNGLYRYNIKSNTWSSLTGPPVSKAYNGPMQAVNGKLYQFGGVTNTYTPTNTMYIYTPETDSWDVGANMPVSVSSFAAASTEDRIYMSGGNTAAGSGPITGTYCYNTTTDTWTTLAVRPFPLGLGFSASICYGGNFYTFGGNDSNSSGLNVVNCYKYNIASDIWTSIRNLPAISSYGAVGILNGKLWLLGGAGVSSNPKKTIYEYNFQNDTWTINPTQLTNDSYFYGCVAPILR